MFPAAGQNMTVRQYIDSFKNIAMREMLEFKIPASITLAQGLLESGSGNSRLAKGGATRQGETLLQSAGVLLSSAPHGRREPEVQEGNQ